MASPRTVVIPFGVPSHGRGLGVGLAALVHSLVQTDGEGVGIAQLHARHNDEGRDRAEVPVEAFVSPAAWRDMEGRSDAPTCVSVVITGSFEPPFDGSGGLRLLAFDAHDGRVRANVEAPVEGEEAGATLFDIVERFWPGVGVGDLGALRPLRELAWESLESVLMAEQCALHDPARGGPHDRLAAMAHLGRAIGEAPRARYPIARLAALAMDVAVSAAFDPRLGAAAVRALERAASDASSSVELVEAMAALLLRLGQPYQAERRANMAIAIAPARARAYGLLAQALRLQGRLDEAAAALDAGTAAAGADPAFAIERGTVLAAAGDTQAAARVWREVLAQDAMNAGAFVRLAALALQGQDMNAAQLLIDSALASPRASAEVLRSALQLMFGTEADGIPRASRLLRLGEKLLECAPHDVGALLVTARAFLALGDRVEASSRLSMIERLEPKSAAAAEVQAMRLAMDNPGADLEIQSVLRAAHSVVPERLADVSARARRLATLHGAWGGWLAAAVADRRRSRPAAARNALEVALEAAPGASLLHLELAAVLIDLGDPLGAVSHAQSALAFEGPSYRALLMSARAFHAAGRSVEAAQAARAVLQLQPGDAAALGLLAHRAPSKPKRSWVEELRRAFARLRVSGT